MSMRVSTAMIHDSAARSISQGQAQLQELGEKLSSGKRINRPSDDPVAAASAMMSTSRRDMSQMWKDSADAAGAKISSAQLKVSESLGYVQSLREKVVAARDGVMSKENLAQLGEEVGQLASSLSQSANSQDADGLWLFAGASAGAPAFSGAPGAQSYGGDQIEQRLQIGSSSTVQTRWSGSEVFSVKSRLDATNGAGNAGTGYVEGLEGTATAPLPLTVSISAGAGGRLLVSAFDASGAQALPPTDWAAGADFMAGGARISISGEPKAGDSFKVAPSGNSLIQNLAADFASTLKNAGTLSSGDLASKLASLSRRLSDGESTMLSTLAQMGGAMNFAESRSSALSADRDHYEAARSSLEDLDYAKGVSDFQKQQTALDAAMKSHAMLTKSSLFDYI